MGSTEITAAKMICNSINALTREVYLMRKAVLEKDAGEKTKGLEKDIPPADDGGILPCSTGCG